MAAGPVAGPSSARANWRHVGPGRAALPPPTGNINRQNKRLHSFSASPRAVVLAAGHATGLAGIAPMRCDPMAQDRRVRPRQAASLCYESRQKCMGPSSAAADTVFRAPTELQPSPGPTSTYAVLKQQQLDANTAVQRAQASGSAEQYARAVALRRMNTGRIAAYNIGVMKRKSGAAGFAHNEVVSLDSDSD